jgi:hypothetical protein
MGPDLGVRSIPSDWVGACQGAAPEWGYVELS